MSLLINWKNEDFLTLEKGVLLANHGLAETGYFSDAELAQLIDNHPDSELTISTMGSDPTRFEWIEGDRNGVAGADLIALAQQGKLWMNLRNVLDHHSHLAKMVGQMYRHLQRNAPHFRAEDRSANLLISSSQAMVHYHVDMPVNMLWHIRGHKRVWVYPHFDLRFVSPSVLEKVCAGELSEDVPYDPEFDNYALVFDVQPGQLLTWPQMTPHRVQNLGGLCVSLSTEHKNSRARRRINMFEANYWLRKNLGWGYHNRHVDSLSALAKQALMRGLRQYRKLQGQNKEQFVYAKTFAVDLTAPGGIRMLDVAAVVPDELAPT